MTMRSSILVALLAGIAGVFIGRAMPRGTSVAEAHDSASPSSSTEASSPAAAAPTREGCRAERTELASTKAQLAICMAFVAPVRKTEPSSVPERSERDTPELDPVDPQRAPTAAEIRRNRELLDSYTEAVIVQLPDGTTGVYKPEEWPTDGDGVIVARKLPSGQIGWYAGPEAGPRSDPAAFRRLELPEVAPPTIVRGADGTLTVNGKPGGPALQRMFPGTPRPAAQ
ncbi:hypothetical protein [Sorangium sp. So ce1335]|uniref:hypothetical protein n=1 Tax=Sorangium sp. So ce1335 TaxID=3133335 RepID=UPI003F62E986